MRDWLSRIVCLIALPFGYAQAWLATSLNQPTTVIEFWFMYPSWLVFRGIFVTLHTTAVALHGGASAAVRHRRPLSAWPMTSP